MATLSLTIPKSRIGVLIGHGGAVKKRIEESLNVKVTVDSRTGEVKVENEGDVVNALKARDIVEAVARGFSTERAFHLLEEERIIDIIDLRDFFGKNESQIQRIKGRIIGKRGKARKMIEEMAGVSLSVYGHTVSIIGSYENVSIAREAVTMLIEGKQHNTVYKYLRIKRGELKKKMKVKLWENGRSEA